MARATAPASGNIRNIVAPASLAGHIDLEVEAHHLHQVSLGCTGMARGSLSPLLPPVSRSRPLVRPLRPPCKPRAVVSHTIPLVFDHQGFFTSYRRVSRPISFFSPCFPGLTRGVLTPIQWFRAALRSRRRPH